MNENPPLPPPSGVTCPNCGAAQSTSVAFCNQCGAALPPKKSKSTLALLGKIIVTFVLLTGALGLGAFGACFMLIGGIGGGSSATNSNSGAFVMLGFAALLGILGVAWIVFWARREK